MPTKKTPLPLNEHILMTINDINSMDNWELVCHIAGISSDTELSNESLLNVMNSIAVFRQERGQAETRAVLNDSYLTLMDELGDTPENTLNLYVAFLKEQIVEGNGEYSIHRKPNMNTLFLNPEVTNEEMSTDKLMEFNSAAMRHYYTRELEEPEPSKDELKAMFTTLSSVFADENTNNLETSDHEATNNEASDSGNKEDEKSESSYSYESEYSYSYDEDEVSESSESSSDEKSESDRSYSSDSESSYSSDSESSSSSSSESSSSSSSGSSDSESSSSSSSESSESESSSSSSSESSESESSSSSSSESSESESSYSSESESSYSSESSEDEIDEKPVKRRRRPQPIFAEDESDIEAEKKEEEPVKRRRRPQPIFAEDESDIETEKKEEKPKRKRTPLIFPDSSSDDEELDNSNKNNVNKAKPKNKETQAEREARRDRENLAAEHRAIMDRGIGLDEFNSFRFDPKANMSDENLKGIKFIQRLTGVRLNENCTYDDCITALDKLIINGKSAYEYFGLENEPKDMTAIQNKVLPGLTNIMDNIFMGWNYESDSPDTPFIFVKENLRIEPLKLNVSQLANSEYKDGFEANGLPSKRLISEQEARQFVLSECMNELAKHPDNAGKHYSNGYLGEMDRERLYNQYLIQSPHYFNEKGSDVVEKEIDYICNIKNLSNKQLLEDYYSRYMPVAMNCKELKGPLQEGALLHIYDGTDIDNTHETKKEKETREAVQAYVAKSRDSYLLIHIKQEIERRLYYVMDAKYQGELGESIGAVMKANRENYNNYLNNGAFHEEGELSETLKAQAEKYNEVGDSYARLLNNEIIDPDAKTELESTVNTLPDFKFSFDDIKDPATLMTALRSKDFGFENIHINGESVKDILKDISGKEFDKLTDEDFKIISRGGVFKEKIFKQFEMMSHLDMCIDAATGKYNIPVITLKTDVYEIAPQMTAGKKLEALPKVDEFPEWRKKISRQSTIDANAREFEEYKNSVSAMNKREQENESLDEVNNAIRVNTRLALDQMLASADMLYARDNLNNPRNRQVQEVNLSTLQQRSTSFNNNASTGLTQPVHTDEHENRIENSISSN